MLALPLTDSQIFNIEKADLMRVLREEPSFDDAKLSRNKERPSQGSVGVPLLLPDLATLGGGTNSLYSLLQMEVAAEAAAKDGGKGKVALVKGGAKAPGGQGGRRRGGGGGGGQQAAYGAV